MTTQHSVLASRVRIFERSEYLNERYGIQIRFNPDLKFTIFRSIQDE